MGLSEAELSEMEERNRHRVEPWRPRAKEEVRMREDNRRLIEEVRRLTSPLKTPTPEDWAQARESVAKSD